MKTAIILVVPVLMSLGQACNTKTEAQTKKTELMYTLEDHYTFELSDNVTREKVRFRNRYGIELIGDLYLPKNGENNLPALAISGPFGAVKEQSSGLYANQMAKRGFVALAFDPSYTGESGGEPRNVASIGLNPEIMFPS
jgi:hypothetical protein